MTNFHQKKITALGTTWLIETSSPISQASLNWLKDFEKQYSRFQSSSFLNQISRHPGTYTLSTDAVNIFNLYFHLNQITQGLFTPTIGQNLTEAGYDTNYSLTPKPLSQLPSLKDILNLSSNQLTIKKPIQLDFGGIGKGYAIDQIYRFHSYQKYVYINAGGDIYLKSQNQLSIALEHPSNPKKAIGLATFSQGSLCGSSGNRRRWSNFHHILNPQTHTSPNHLSATWVYAKSATLADSLATCLFLVSPTTLLTHFDFEYLLLDNQLRVTQSQNFPAKLFYAQ